MINRLLSFLDASPVNFLAVKNIADMLEAGGFRHLDPCQPLGTVKAGDRFFVTKNDSSIYAFRIGSQPLAEAGFHMICAHSDSPTFRIKPKAEMLCEGGLVKLNTEVYGGPIMSTWFDRPLTLAGRVIVRSQDVMRPDTMLLHNGCGNPNHHFHPTPPPHRPHRPVAHCCHRPVFPTNYRPYAYAPTINAIFGLRFGFSLGYSIDILANNGYVIDGYTNSEIYLRNVRNSGYQWDDAIIYYDDYGNMAGVSFYDSTTRYSTRRYDAVYAHLCNIYGRPAIINNYQGSLSASWWDGSGRSYITLSLGYGNAFGGYDVYPAS